MIRKIRLAVVSLALAAGLTGLSAAAASAHTHPYKPCPGVYLWANPVLHHQPLFCYANL